MIRIVSSPNIALIKYWGNRNDALRLPAADSLSITLAEPQVEIQVDVADVFSVQSFFDEKELILKKQDMDRIRKHFDLCNDYLERSLPQIALNIRSHIPPGIGLASSAAVFSAIAYAYAALSGKQLHDKEKSVLARLGSGSASRSVFGGFVAMIAGEGDAMDSAYARQIAPSDHWELYDVIIAPDVSHKKIGSTEGHALAHTSPHFSIRLEAIRSKRQKECIDAITKKDFEKLQSVSEEDCMDMHKIMETSTPPLQYLNEETYRIIHEVEELRRKDHLEVLYTMDAGPTVHLICTQSALSGVREYADAQKGCMIFESGIGNGTQVVS